MLFDCEEFVARPRKSSANRGNFVAAVAMVVVVWVVDVVAGVAGSEGRQLRSAMRRPIFAVYIV